MAFLPSVVGIEDENGQRVDQPRADGTRAPIMLRLGSGLNASSEPAGGVTRVHIDSVGGGSSTVGDAVADLAALRAVAAVDREDRQERGVAALTESFMFLASSGAGVADDGEFVVRPNDISVGTAGRWYKMPYQITRNLQQSGAALTDADQILTVGGGRRYLQSTALSTRRVKTLSTTGAVKGDTITIERRDNTHHGLRVFNGGPGGGMLSTSVGPRDSAVYRFDGTNWALDRTQLNTTRETVFNVKDFGADGLDGLGNSAAAEAAAIQAAIDAAWACALSGTGDGAVVYLPRGRYRTDGVTLIWRRTAQFNPITMRGEGWGITQINNSTGTVIQADSLASDPSSNGGYMHTIEELCLSSGDFHCFRWTNGLTSDSQRPQLHFRKVWFSRAGATGPACEIQFGFRCRFSECMYAGGTTRGGGFLRLDTCGGVAAWGCNQLGAGGYFVDAVDSGEICFTACRSEGARDIAAWKFVGCTEVALIACTNEGKFEYPACFYFENCKSITADACGLASNDGTYVRRYDGSTTQFVAATSKIVRNTGSWADDHYTAGQNVTVTGSVSNNGTYLVTNVSALELTVGSALVNEGPSAGITVAGDKFADGMQFVNCRSVTVRGADVPAAFYSQGDGAARAIRIDGSCVDIHCNVKAQSGASTDAAVDASAVDCSVGVSYPGGILYYGKQTSPALDVQEQILDLNTKAGALPSNFCGLSIRRGLTGGFTEENHAVFVWDEANQSFRVGLDTAGNAASTTTLSAHRGLVALKYASSSTFDIITPTGTSVNLNVGTPGSFTNFLFFDPAGGNTVMDALARFLRIKSTSATGIEITAPVVNIIGTGSNGVWLTHGATVRLATSAAGVEIDGTLKLRTVVDPAAAGVFGLGANGRLVQYVGGQARGVVSEVREHWRKTAADGAAGTATAELAVLMAKEGITLRSIELLPDAALTASDTDYATFTLRKRDGAGGAAVTVATATTRTTGGGGLNNFSAWQRKDLGALSNASLAANNLLTLEITKTGAGVVVPALAMIVSYTVDQ